MAPDDTTSAPVVAVIPARGGSRGIPRKNLARLGGVSLLAHSIEHARRAAAVDETWVSTDDDEIAREAERWGARVVRRPAELATDEAPSEPALVHALEHRRAEGLAEPRLVVFLQCTSPLRTPDDVDRAVAELDASGADSLFSAAPLEGFVWTEGADGPRPAGYSPAERPRRQETEPRVVENGSIYVFRPSSLASHGHRLGGRVAVYRMDPLSILQIDRPQDLELHRRLLALHPFRPLPRPERPIRLLMLDFDGVMTDDRVLVDQDGREAVWCSREDGLGIERLRAAGVEVAVLSKESNPVVTARCRKLGIEAIRGADDKLPELERLAAERGLSAEEIAFVGNDVNDLECLGWVGLPVAVADARPVVRRAAMLVTEAPGGDGAVREVCELLLAATQAT